MYPEGQNYSIPGGTLANMNVYEQIRRYWRIHGHMIWERVNATIVSDSVSGAGVIEDEMHIRSSTFTIFLCASKATYRSDQSLVKYSWVKSEISLHCTGARIQNHVVNPNEEIEMRSQPGGRSPLIVSLVAPNFLQSVSTKHKAGHPSIEFKAPSTSTIFE